jgi:pyruvate dehydrogenase E2 component (dihydrolipoyllysine-residue acetyltransferase)
MATTKSDPNVFLLPDLGEGVHEAELVSWKVKEGDTVEELQVLAEMETDKALAEVPSPRAGTIQTLHGKDGEILHVGQPLVTFVGGAGESASAATEPAKPAAPPVAEAKEEREDAGSVVGSLSAMPTATEGKALATPAVRRIARDLGIDINQVPGSGIGSRVMEKDVRAFAGSGAPAAAPTSTITDGSPAGAAPAFAPAAVQFPAVAVDASGVAERIPFRGVRRKIAEALSRSVHTAVHFTCVDAADVTRLDQMRRQLAGMTGRKISFLPFIMQAVCHGLKQHPTINANVDDEKSEILIKGVINLGCAVDTDHGLMVPVLANADRLTILELGDKVAELAGACKNRTIEREKLTGGTFTISNVGSYGGMFATPIINYPEVGIIAIGRAKRRVMARDDGSIFAGLSMPLSVSCDHRVVDGAEAARFLNTVVRTLEDPERLTSPAGK